MSHLPTKLKGELLALRKKPPIISKWYFPFNTNEEDSDGNHSVSDEESIGSCDKFERYVIVMNVGDSRAVLGKWVDGKLQAQRLSVDHKPLLLNERQRIRDLGG